MKLPLSILKIATPFIRILKPGFFIFGHGITDKPNVNSLVQYLHMELDQFDTFIKIFKNVGFRFISMDEALEITSRKKKVNYPWIHLTFDDGYRNNFTVIYPFLKSRNIPFTVFLSTRNLIERKRFDNHRIICGLLHTKNELAVASLIEDYKIPLINSKEQQILKVVATYKYFIPEVKEEFMERIDLLLTKEEWGKCYELYETEDILSIDEIKIMDKDPLVCFGSHGHNHYILSTLSEQQIHFEQMESRKILQNILSKPILTYCYPNGKPQDYPKNIHDITAGNNYKYGFTTVPGKIGVNQNHFEIPRFSLSLRSIPKIFLKLVFS